MQVMTADAEAPPNQPPVKAVPGFALLFSVSLPAIPRAVDLDAALRLAGVTSFSAQQLSNYRHLRDETEVHVLGRAFMDAGRLTHSAIGRIALTRSANDPHGPTVADVNLFVHVAGVALWEVWLPGLLQDFNARRWTAWLDDQSPDSLPTQVWQVLQPLNLAWGGQGAYRQYLPCSVVRLPTQPLAALTAGQSADIARLLWRDHSARRLKPDVADVEMARLLRTRGRHYLAGAPRCARHSQERRRIGPGGLRFRFAAAQCRAVFGDGRIAVDRARRAAAALRTAVAADAGQHRHMALPHRAWRRTGLDAGGSCGIGRRVGGFTEQAY